MMIKKEHIFKNKLFIFTRFVLINLLLFSIGCSSNSKEYATLVEVYNQAVPGNNGHGCSVPNQFSVVQEIANNNQDILRSGSQLNRERASNGPLSQSLDDSRWKFMDMVVTRLRSADSRWGYTCIRGNCKDISTDSIAYWCGSGDPGESTNVGTIDIINSSGHVQWLDHTPETMQNRNSSANWIHPRPGTNVTSPDHPDQDVSDFAWDKVTFLNGRDVSGWKETSIIDSVSVSQRGLCIDHPKNGKWPARSFGDIQVEANHWIIVKMDGKYYAGTYEWIRAGGQVCKLEGSLNKIYHELGKDQINKAPLNSSWVPKGGGRCWLYGFRACQKSF